MHPLNRKNTPTGTPIRRHELEAFTPPGDNCDSHHSALRTSLVNPRSSWPELGPCMSGHLLNSNKYIERKNHQKNLCSFNPGSLWEHSCTLCPWLLECAHKKSMQPVPWPPKCNKQIDRFNFFCCRGSDDCKYPIYTWWNIGLILYLIPTYLGVRSWGIVYYSL